MLMNRAHWDTLPPVEVPKLLGVDYRFGPAAQIPSRGRGAKFMDSPTRAPSVALGILDMLEAQKNSYFGIWGEGVPVEIVTVKTERMLKRFFLAWSEAFQQMVGLIHRHADPVEVERVCGSSEWLQKDPEEVSRQADFIMEFDVKDLSPDLMGNKLEAISNSVLPEDSGGIIDRAKLTMMKLKLIDPQLAKAVSVDSGEASQKLFREVNQQVALMALGNQAELTENDPAAKTKQKYLEDIIQSNPMYQNALKDGGRFGELLEQYQGNLQQSIVQEENKMVGRLGVKPEVGA